MKALILSNVHSNIYALEAIWKEEKDSDLVYCAGDLVDYGPYPKEVLNWIRSHNVSCVQGIMIDGSSPVPKRGRRCKACRPMSGPGSITM